MFFLSLPYLMVLSVVGQSDNPPTPPREPKPVPWGDPAGMHRYVCRMEVRAFLFRRKYEIYARECFRRGIIPSIAGYIRKYPQRWRDER